MHRSAIFIVSCVLSTLALVSPTFADGRVPGDHWRRFVDPADAGFDAEKLAAAKKIWEAMPSSAFMVVADGAVVAAWGDIERRFMCHSVRKSFLSALYGIYWDRGEIDLNKNLADLGIDDEPSRLLETEKRARILDLLKARSGVFHPAAYAGRTDSRRRGSQGPGRYFAYNNWDFNTLATILEQETGARVFEAFDQHFARPLGMEDWRISDGYYHYELDKSKYPAYPFRMSARDAARFGLLFTRDGVWDETTILSRHWVRRSSALYSIDNEHFGYGLMWWVFRDPRFTPHGMFAALGVGNQMIAALPDSDLVMVNRADTFEGEGTPSEELRELIAEILEARTGIAVENPVLVPLERGEPDPGISSVSADRLEEFVGTWSYPPASLGLPESATVEIRVADGYLVGYSPEAGTFELYLQPDGSLHEADSHERYLPVRGADGAFTGIADPGTIMDSAIAAAARGEKSLSKQIFGMLVDESVELEVGRNIAALIGGESGVAKHGLQKLIKASDAGEIEAAINGHGYGLLGSQHLTLARKVFEANTELFPDSSNTWDSLGEAQMLLGEDEGAIRSYGRSLEINADNGNAETMIARIRAGSERDEGVPALMEKARVPGLTLAVIDDGEITRTEFLGVSDSETGSAITAETLFEAASLSKPVFATVVLRLAARGELDLDQSLSELLPYERLAQDRRYEALTARIVLSHRTGLPNWGGEKLELGSYPGTQFGYSGEGYVYLQKVVEKITGLTLDELARREVFEPLGMSHSRYSWNEGDSLVLARPHDEVGTPQDKQNAYEDNAAASLHTTAADYARFVIAWMGDGILPSGAIRQALAPAVGMRWEPNTTEKPREVAERIAWGLGWGLQLPAPEQDNEQAGGQNSEPIVWHWGDNGPFKAFVAFRPKSRSGVVYFANGSNGLAIGELIVSEVVGDMEPTFRWLDYERVDSPGFVERLAGAQAEGAGRYREAIEAFEAALAVDADDEETRRRVEWLEEMVAAMETPIALDDAELERFAGSYGPRQLIHRDGALYYQREGRGEYRLLALSANLFALEGMPSFRLEVVSGEAGLTSRLVGHYVNGVRDESPRDSPSED